jgi:transcriptional regulator with XRE-family HTH domain
MGTTTLPKKEIQWLPALIRELRGKRTQAEFGALLGVPKNTVWRWEARHVKPDPEHARRLSKLAERERFLADWKLLGSLRVVGDLEEASREVRRLFHESVERTAHELAE